MSWLTKKIRVSVGCYEGIALLLLIMSCDTDKTPWHGDPDKSTPFICDDGTTFAKTGNAWIYNALFIDVSLTSFYSINEFENRVAQYDINNLQVMRHHPLLPLKIMTLRHSPRVDQTAWVITRADDESVTASLMDTLANIDAGISIGTIINDRNGFEIDTTPDNGFVLVANPGNYNNTDKYQVYRYSDKAILLWQRELVNRGTIKTIKSLKDGGFLIGGSNYTGGGSMPNSYVTKLDQDGNQLWAKIKHNGDNLVQYFSITDIEEDSSGDYFFLLESSQRSLSLIRSDTAYNILWSTVIDNSFGLFTPRMEKVESDMLVYFSAGTGRINTFDINFVSVNKDGNVNWKRVFGGNGDEDVFGLCYVKNSGYYLIGRTTNYDGASVTDQAYVIKTDLEGNSCQ